MRRNITWSSFEAGDVIITLSGEQAKVLGRMGEVLARSGWFNFDTFSEIISVADAKKKGWRFIQPNGKVPMTQDELEAILGRKIDITS